MKTDLIKVLNDQNVKAEAPVIRIGDTVRVHIKIKEGAKSVSRSSKALSSPRSTAASTKPSPSAVSPMAWAWKRYSPCIPPTWFRWKPSARARCVVQSCTTCVAVLARLQRSRPSCNFC